MNLELLLVGTAKLLFGIVVGVVGTMTAARTAKRMSGFPSITRGLRAGNTAVGISLSGMILAMGILVQHAIRGTFDALDLLIHQADVWYDAAWVLLYGLCHVAAALGVGALIIVIGTRTFIQMTPSIDEISEIEEGNIASSLVLASVLVVLALLTQQGVDTILNGLLPLPVLGRDAWVAPN